MRSSTDSCNFEGVCYSKSANNPPVQHGHTYSQYNYMYTPTHDFCSAHCICAVSVDKLHWQRLYFYQSYSFSLLFLRIYTIVSSAYILCSLNKLTVCKSNMELRYHNRGGNTCALLPYEIWLTTGRFKKMIDPYSCSPR